MLQQSVQQSNTPILIQQIPFDVLEYWKQFPEDAIIDYEPVNQNIHSINFHHLPSHWVISWQCPCPSIKTIFVFDSLHNRDHLKNLKDELRLFYNVDAFELSYLELTTQQGKKYKASNKRTK